MRFLHFFVCMLALPVASQAITLHVSKLGDNTTGGSWAHAFTTIQAALHAIPDDNGGHRIVIRPDRYMEANLFPAHRGAPGAYNELLADSDGSLGSGTKGYAVIDSGDPERGFKSIDWWTPFRADRSFSSLGWDRWRLQHLYTTGADAGLGWDMTAEEGAEFTVVVEDCVGIGRAFGGLVGAFNSRPAEPVVYRRCRMWCLDWWGDASGAYARANNTEMPDHHDVVYEDCTLVGPDNAFQAGNPGYDGYTRVKFKDCRLVSLNFSQPRGTPSSGIIYSTIKGEYLHVDFENCTLMGYKVFGAGDDGDIAYSTQGSVQAYVQFEQEIPSGFFRLASWPTELFQTILPPEMPTVQPHRVREGVVRHDMCEFTPFIWKGRLCMLECVRPAHGGDRSEYYLTIHDVESGKQMARFAEGYGLASALVNGESVYVFASRFENDNWNDVTLFQSSDLERWTDRVVIEQDVGEHLFNSSVCADSQGFSMAYESNDPHYPAFTTKFARSRDLQTWTRLEETVFGSDRYTACPCIRYVDGHYYLLYLERRSPLWRFETFVARSKDLQRWQLSPSNPVLRPQGTDEGINTSDSDIIEWDGKTYVYYAVGDQRTWMNAKRLVFPGTLPEFFEGYFPRDAEAVWSK